MLLTVGGPRKRPFLSGVFSENGEKKVHDEERKRTIETSYDVLDVPKRKIEEPQKAIEPLSTTQRMACVVKENVKENKYLLFVGGAIIMFLGSQLMTARDSARDSANMQPLVDQHQDYQIQQNDKNIEKMHDKMDTLISEVRKLMSKKVTP